MTRDESELRDIPRRLKYEESYFGTRIDALARMRHASLLKRQEVLKEAVHWERVQERWVRMKYPKYPRHTPPKAKTPPGVLTPMGMDELIVGRRIVDDWR